MATLSLLDLLSNEYLLLSTTPYLLPTELFALARCSRSYYNLVKQSRSVWRHLNLSESPCALPTATSTSTSAIAPRTRTPLYQTELNSLLSKPFVLRDVKTLVLDGLPVTVELLHDLLSSTKYKIQLLSIRGCNLLNERQLMLLFQYLVRTSRETPPALQGCYWFGDMDLPGGIFSIASKPARSAGANAKGRFIKRAMLINDWIGILKQCQGKIAFDTRLCTGPRHDPDDQQYIGACIVSIRLTGKCSGCGAPPELKRSDDLAKVVVAPVPLTSSDIRVACKAPDRDETKDILSCEACVKNRWCERCGGWFCERCVAENSEKKLVSLECYDCGTLCGQCTEITSRTCKSCRGEYCVVHNEGADNNWCEWCNSPERRLREFNRTHTDLYTLQQRARTLARLNAIRNSFTSSRFQDEVIVRNRCLVTL